MNLQSPFSCLSYFAVFAGTDGTYSWGKNSNGTLGLGRTTDKLTPEPIPNLPQLAHLTSSYVHVVALTEDQEIMVWGEGGTLGLDDGPSKYTPHTLVLPSNEKIVKVTCGSKFTLALTQSGSVYGWGHNKNNQLGLGLGHDDLVPTPTLLPPFPAKVIDIAGGHYHSFVLLENGLLYGAGVNSSGELGLGFVGSDVTTFNSVLLSDVVQVSCGSCHSMAITKDGSLYTWGWNGNGSLGLGDTQDRCTPTRILSDASSLAFGTIVAVANGGSHCLALKKDGSLWAWGYNDCFQLGNSENRTYQVSPKPVDFSHSDILDSAKNSELVPQIFPKISGFGCGWSFSYVVDSEENLYIWGSVTNSEPLAKFPTKVSQFKARKPVPPSLRFMEGKWKHVISWLFLGKLDWNSVISVFPDEVIFNFVEVMVK